MGAFNLTPTVQVFPCPHCGETINTSLQECSFCHSPIDHTAAKAAAAETNRISSACSDASYLKIMLALLIPFGLLIFVPLLNLIGLVGFVFLKYAVPVMTIRWWIMYRSITTADPDFHSARGTVIFVSAITLLVVCFLRVSLFGLSVRV